jgi:VIT1/CCC1 family predicted Fe2+/Mn2+ transporter|tara:strand:+ start:311 stop:808 length:498 start_codon:yes stop_codon:yes gene_type:complete
MKELLSEFIYGGMDGIITTVAIIGAILGANIHTKYALILGMANIIADGFSMGISRYNSLIDLRKSGNTFVTPAISGLYTFLFFILMGSIPLIPFLFVSLKNEMKMRNMLFLFSLFAFILIGGIKGIYTKKIFTSMTQVVGIGLFGALISYFVAKYINSKIRFNDT